MPIPCPNSASLPELGTGRFLCGPGAGWQTAAVTPPIKPAARRPPLLQTLAAQLAGMHPDRRIFAAVDGVDGSGKTTFADALAAVVAAAPHRRPAVRISLDDFHHPRARRYRQGRGSAEGFRHDSYNLEQFRACVLDPLQPGADGCYRPAGHDLASDAVLDPPSVAAPPAAVVLVDGLFLHRAELAPHWDFSVFLDVPFSVAAARMAVRDGTPADPEHPAMHRYVGGQRLYFADTDPALQASVVVENSDPARPFIIAASAAGYRRQPSGRG